MKQGIIEAVHGFSFEREAYEGVLYGQQLTRDFLVSAVLSFTTFSEDQLSPSEI